MLGLGIFFENGEVMYLFRSQRVDQMRIQRNFIDRATVTTPRKAYEDGLMKNS